MKNEIRKGYNRMNFCFVNSSLEIDHNDKEMMEAAKTQNFSLLVHYFRRHGMRNLAINTLLQQRKNSKNFPVIVEIIYTYLYFKDCHGALDYIKHNEFTNTRVKHIGFLIKVHLAIKQGECDNTVLSLVKEGLRSGYDRSFINILREYCLASRMGDCLKKQFLEIQAIIEANYYHMLDYKEAKFLYKMMPKKHIFLKKMVKCNPLIKKKYYIEYANIEGFQREDVIRILMARYRVWAVKIAMYHGWVDEDIRIATEMKFSTLPICIYGKTKKDWLIKKEKHHHFHNKISKTEFKSLRFDRPECNNGKEDESSAVESVL